jgi:hypothetical protein
MRSLTTLPLSRTPRFVERPAVAAVRNDKRQPPDSTTTAPRHDRGLGRFLTALMHALATPAA